MTTTNSPGQQAKSQPAVLMVGTDDSVLLPARVCANTAGISISHFHDLVGRGLAPQADVRLGPRCVRWRAGTVRHWIDSISAD